MSASPRRDVFVNCPFDEAYSPFFNAIVFTVIRSGFRARCAREVDDGGQNRLEKISKIIGECRYGVHDISRTEVDGDPPLPRFNMPLELGLFLGVRLLGNRSHKQKRCIIFDTERHRYQRYISDIAGQDIHAHQGDVSRLIRELAAWLRDQSGDRRIPGGNAIAGEFDVFNGQLPAICAERTLQIEELTFGDYTAIIVQYLKVAAA
jgi:hypothetical protein